MVRQDPTGVGLAALPLKSTPLRLSKSPPACPHPTCPTVRRGSVDPRLSLRPYRLSSRRAGPVRLFAEIRYHWVTRHFDEGRNADTFVPISFGIMLGR